MSGLGLVLDIAKGALAAQSYGLDVTAHNIANVNTEGYSRQRAVYQTNDPFLFAGGVLGRGVNVGDVLRRSDQFIDDQVAGQRGGLASSQEAENFMNVLEGLFNENSESSVSVMLADFWNMWHDIANNPSGDAERIVVYEHSMLLSEQFNTLNTELTQLQTDLTNALTSAVGEINQIASEIGDLNNQIVGMEAGSSIANDLRDKRNYLIWQLSEYLDVNTFEQTNGALTVVTALGCILVNASDNYELSMNGSAVEWEASSGSTVDITNHLSTGKLGGWLDMRDETIAKYKLDMDELAEEFVWTVNQQHSQGVGLVGFSSVTGTYAATTPANAITDSGLSYQGKVDDTNQTFQIWLFDTDGVPYDSDGGAAGLQGNPITITVAAGDTVNDLVANIDGETGVQASISNGLVTIAIDTGEVGTLGSLAFANDTSNVLAALGINTFFTGSTAGGIGVNSQIGSDKDYIAAAQVDTDAASSSYGYFATGDNTNARAVADLQSTSQTISQWTVDRVNGNTEGSVSATIEDYFHSFVGSIGTKSASISRSKGFYELMVNKLERIRDSISAVSLDEEMTNMMKFQHGYTAAAKLISVADEMLNVLLSIK